VDAARFLAAFFFLRALAALAALVIVAALAQLHKVVFDILCQAFPWRT